MGGGFGSEVRRPHRGGDGREAREGGGRPRQALSRPQRGASRRPATGPRPCSGSRRRRRKDGKLTALHLVVHGNGGTNGGTGTSGPLKNVYACDNVKTEEYDVFTNAGPSAAMRAPGHPQGAFALEATMDELAAQARHGPARVPAEERSFRDPARGVPDRRREDRLDQSRRAAEDLRTRRVRRGVGVGAAIWYNTGGTGPKATVHDPPRRLGGGRPGRAGPRHRRADDGRASWRPKSSGCPSRRSPSGSATRDMPYGPGSGGSTTTPSSAPADPAGGLSRQRRIAELVAKEWAVAPADVRLRRRRLLGARQRRAGSWRGARRAPNFRPEGVSATGERAENHADAWKRFTAGAQFAEVEVDTETGRRAGQEESSPCTTAASSSTR